MPKNPHPKVEIYDDVFELKDFKIMIPIINVLDYDMNIGDGSHPYFTANCLKNESQKEMQGPRSILLESLSKTVPFNRVKKEDIEHCKVQLYTFGSFPPMTNKNQYHKVLVHCLNCTWEETWGGQMCFYDETGKIVCSVAYKPNRAVLFDADLVYRCNTTNVKGPKFMYTLNTTFWKPRVNKKFARSAK